MATHAVLLASVTYWLLCVAAWHVLLYLSETWPFGAVVTLLLFGGLRGAFVKWLAWHYC